MKISAATTLLLASSANAFLPAAQRPFGTRVSMSEEAEKVEAAAEAPKAAEPVPVPVPKVEVAAVVPEPAPAPVAPPAAPPAPKKEIGGALVTIKEETVEFTAGLIGGAAGFLIGGPVLGAIAAAAANYASKMNGDTADVIQAVSKSSIQVFNYLANLDQKYEVLGKAQGSLDEALVKLKANPSVNPETIKKVEGALGNTKGKISEINEEYDLVGGGMTALGVVGDLVEKAVKKAGELNSEYALSEKAVSSLKGAVAKAKESADKASKA